jgi:hypothetical protein
MPIQQVNDSQKIDYLWKKIAFGATKTDISGNIDATQEPFASPLQIRGDTIWQQSALIPAVLPASNSSVVTVYSTAFPVECSSDAGIPTPTLTWTTGQRWWVPPEFGATYQVKVYIAPSGNAANVASKGTQVFAVGTSNNDQWFFDYQSGILQFNGNNTPYGGASPISFTGNSVYISGAVYSGNLGLPSTSDVGNALLGYMRFTGDTISSTQSNGNIVLNAPGVGIVQVYGSAAVGLPVGDDTTRPTLVTSGYLRFNTVRRTIEFYDGNTWIQPGVSTVTSQTINPDGIANTYALSSNTTASGAIVTINGTVQRPAYSYNIVNNNFIQFTETPLTTDIVEVRVVATGSGQTVGSLSSGAAAVNLDNSNVVVTGNLVPSANVTYSLGNVNLQWKDLWISGNTIYLGGKALAVANGQLTFGGNVVGSQYGNVDVANFLPTYTGNLSAGNLSLTSALPVNQGGTGGTTATQALTNLLPAGAQTGYVLTTAGTGSYYWSSAGAGGGGTVGQSLSTLRQSNTATAGQSVFTLTGNITYTPGTGQLRVYVNGVRQFPAAYTETSSNTFTLSSGVSAGTAVFAEIDAFSTFNNYANLTYASNVGNIAAAGLTVQSAISSLETNKAPLSNPVFSGTVTAGFFSGNGSALTGLPAGYSNVQTATYLPGYTGTVGTSLLNSTGNILSTGAIHNSLTVNGNVNLGNNNLIAPKLNAYSEAVTVGGNVSGSVNVDLSLTNVFTYTLVGSTTFTFTNAPAANVSKPVTLIIRQDSTGSRTASFTAAKWTDGLSPTLTTTANKYDVFTFFTIDGGTSYFATYAMANVS